LNGHIHDSAIQATVILAVVLLGSLGWNIVSAKLADRATGKAMHSFF